MFRKKLTLAKVLKFIHQADNSQVSEIIQALVSRYGEVHPDWDVAFLSLPKNNPAERENMIQSALHFLHNM